MKTAKAAKSYVESWNRSQSTDELFNAFCEEMRDLGKIVHEIGSPDQFGSNDISAIKEFNLKARKLSCLIKQPNLLPEDWFEKKIRQMVLGNIETKRIVHCFDGAAKGGWRPYPLFVDWVDFCGFRYDDVSGSLVTTTRSD